MIERKQLGDVRENATVNGLSGVDLHPFGGGLSGMYMGPRLTGNFRDTVPAGEVLLSLTF